MVKQIFINLEKLKHYSLLSKLPFKRKSSIFFLALNDDIEKNKLLKTFLRNTFMNLKILHT